MNQERYKTDEHREELNPAISVFSTTTKNTVLVASVHTKNNIAYTERTKWWQAESIYFSSTDWEQLQETL
jgi:hypothetical protein